MDGCQVFSVTGPMVLKRERDLFSDIGMRSERHIAHRTEETAELSRGPDSQLRQFQESIESRSLQVPGHTVH